MNEIKYLVRIIEEKIRETLRREKSILLLGARQTGKTTLLKHLGVGDLFYTLLDPDIRLKFERSVNTLRQEIAAYRHTNSNQIPIVIIDEVQKLPPLMDIIQLSIDNREAQFILTGSSVRKLRRHSQFNLLPGRVVNFHLDALSLLEMPKPYPDIETLLLYGSLPGIYLENVASTQQADLESYVKNYLEEEVRGEALVRELGSFARFLELAAVEAGNQINVNKLSQESGIKRHTFIEYFCVLEDCLIIEKIEPITQATTRRKLTKSPKYLFFDMGIRRIAAAEGHQLSSKRMGNLFEQFIGLELFRILRLYAPMARLRYWRDHAGPEIDFVIENNKQYLPIEVKWTHMPTEQDTKHLIKFMHEYDCIKPAYVICQCDTSRMLAENIIALPWQELEKIIQQVIP